MTTFLVQHITGGDAFFSGLVLMVVAALLARRAGWRRTRLVSLCVFVGCLLVGASATPLPWWLYGLFALTVVAWYALLAGGTVPKPVAGESALKAESSTAGSGESDNNSSTPTASGHRPLSLTVLLMLMLVIVASWELRWRWTPRVPLEADDRLIILADSVTAGMGEDEAVCWPVLLGERYSTLSIDDRSHAGATVGSVLRLIEERPLDDGVVLLEIGGNDLLGSTSLPDFERDLDRLLSAATSEGRRVVMFELPLPPGANAWGQAQRRLAGQFGVSLIPKRRFISILLSGETTIDSIHLSQSGHVQMLKLMEEVLELNR